jgi:hypothetical protein
MLIVDLEFSGCINLDLFALMLDKDGELAAEEDVVL